MIWRTIKLKMLSLIFLLSTRFTIMNIRRASRTLISIKIISIMRLQNQFNLPLMGDDDSLDHKLYRTVNDFFDLDIERDDLYGKEDRYLIWLLDDPSSNSDHEEYCRIYYWLQSYFEPTKDAEKISSTYNSIYNKEIEQIDESEIWIAYSKFRKKARQERRLLRKSRVRLIDFSLKDIIAFLPLLSIMFVIAGYFHISLLYGHFNVDTSQFFLISDYLASSVEKIQHALYSLSGFAFGILYGFRIDPTITKYERQRYTSWWKEMYTFVPGVIYLFLAYVPIVPSFHISTSPQWVMLPIILVSQTPIFFISIRYFKNGRFVYSLCMAVTISFSSLYTSALVEVDKIEGGRPEMIFEIQSGGQKYTDQDSVFIGSNSRYIFLYNNHKNTRIIPLNQIEYISLETRS